MSRQKVDTKRLKLELQRSVKPLILFGILILCGIASAAYIFHNQTFQRPWEDYYTVKATFDDVKGVTPPTQQVRIAGVKVGVIKNVKLVDGRPQVTLSIESKYGRLYRDARMRLRPSTPLQDMYVSIERGTPAAGKLSEDDVIPGEQAESPVDISRVMNTFNTPTRDQLGTLLDQLGHGLKDRGASLRSAFASAVPFLDAAKRATQVIDRRKLAMRRLVTNFGELTGVLGERNKQIAGLVSGGEQTLGALARSDKNLAATVRELGPTLTTMRSTFAQVRAMEETLDPALKSLDPVLERLEPGLDALEKFGKDATPAMVALRTPVRTLRPLATSLDPAAGSLRSSMRALDPQTPKYDRITAIFPPCLERLSAFFTNSMSLAKFSDDGGVIPRAGSSFGIDTISGLTGAPGAPGAKRMPSCTTGGKGQ